MALDANYLGHRIDAEGLHPLSDDMRAIQEAPAPRIVSELKSYLGYLTLLWEIPGKFVINSCTFASLAQSIGEMAVVSQGAEGI